jgi:two-component system response regulator HupR/HoxA
MEHFTNFVEREPRLPLFVEVFTTPELPECWSVNISRSGLGLVSAAGVEARVVEGQIIEVEFQLPGMETTLGARGKVMWIYGRPARPAENPEAAIGIQFTSMNAGNRLALDRYLLENRLHVAVAMASTEEAALVQEILSGYANLHFEDSEAGLFNLLERGDIAAVLVFGDGGQEVTRMVKRMITAMLEGKGARLLPPDMIPAFIYCAASTSEELVELFNTRYLFRTLRRPFDRNELFGAVQQALSAYGERTEQRRLSHSLERALARHRSASRSTQDLDQSIRQRLVIHSAAMKQVLDLARRAAPHKVSVLLQGETGTGKEVVATLIHELSPRASAAFVVQDCGVLTETLLESELFGHVKGAFTGAIADNPGLFVMADGGTILLDEVENTTADLQAKLLRVIEAGLVRPVGAARTRHVDVRVIAASNRNLKAEVEAGRFREDLYYRLNIFPIRVPPLRERREDVLPLAEHFLRISCDRLQQCCPDFTQRARQALLAYSWPGNVRELRNAVELAILLCDRGEFIDVDRLPEPVRIGAISPADSACASLKTRVHTYEKEIIRQALVESHGVLRRAARALKTSPVTLHRKAIQHGLAAHMNASRSSVSHETSPAPAPGDERLH